MRTRVKSAARHELRHRAHHPPAGGVAQIGEMAPERETAAAIGLLSRRGARHGSSPWPPAGWCPHVSGFSPLDFAASVVGAARPATSGLVSKSIAPGDVRTLCILCPTVT